MVRWFKFLALMFFVLFFLSCGGGGGSTKSSSEVSGRESIKFSTQTLEGSEIGVATSPADQKNPHVVYLPDKRLWFVVYEDWSRGHADIKAKFLRNDGTACGGEITISDHSGNQTFPIIAYKNGSFIGDNVSILAIVWQDSHLNDTSGRRAYVGLRALNVSNIDTSCSTSSITFSNVIPIPATDAMNIVAVNRQTPKIAYNPSEDRFILAWIEVDNAPKGILFLPDNVVVCDYHADNYLKIIDNLNLNNVSSINISSTDIRTLPPIQVSFSRTAQQDSRTYEILKNVSSIDLKCDDTTNECLFAFSGRVATLTVTYTFTPPGFLCTTTEGSNRVYGIYKTRLFYKDSNDGDQNFEYPLLSDPPLLQISDNSARDPQNVSVGFGRSQIEGGGYLVAWEDFRHGRPKIYGQLLLSSRGFVGGNILISFTDTNMDGNNDANVVNSSQTNPYVDFDLTNERFFVIWQDGRNGSVSAENLDIYGQYVDMEGTLRGSNYQISGHPSNQYSPVIAYASDIKQFIAIWTDARNANTTNADIYGQRFSLGMPQLVVLRPDNTVLEPAIIDFGTQTVGSIATRSVKLRNSGDSALSIDCVSGLTSPFRFENLPNDLVACGDGSFYRLEPATEITITISFRPTTNGAFNSSFTIRTNAGTETVSVQGEAVSPDIRINVDNVELTTGAIDFGSIRRGETSERLITITNTGTIDYRITNISGLREPFSIVDSLNYPITLRAGQSLSFRLRFAGNERGLYQTDITIQTDVGISRTISVSGRVIAPVLRVVETSLDFGLVRINNTATRTITVRNEGDDNLNITSVEVPGGQFGVGSYANTVAPNSSITITVEYTPTNLASHTGSVRIITNAGTHTVSLSGSGRGGQASIEPSRVDFGTIPTNVLRTQSLTITNIGNDTLTLSGITSDNPEFTITCSGTCPSATNPVRLAPNGRYTVTINISSSTAEVKTGTLTINTDGVGGNIPTSLYAVAVEPRIEITPSGTLDFGVVSTSTESTRRVTIRNTGTLDITIQSIDLPTEPFSLANAPTLPYTLRAGQAIDLLIKFKPTSPGNYTSSIDLITDVLSAPIRITLRGSGSTSSTASGIYVAYEGSPISTFVFQEYALIGQSLTATLKLVNPSSSPVRIVRVVSSNPEFTVSTALFADIPPNGQDMIVIFTPRSASLREAVILIEDTNRNTVSLTVQGYGTRIKVLEPASVIYSPTSPPTGGRPSGINPVDAVLLQSVNSNSTFSFTVEVASLPQNPKYYLVHNNDWQEIAPTSTSGNRLYFSIPPKNQGNINLTFVIAQVVSANVPDTSINPPPSSSTDNLSGGGCSMVGVGVSYKGAVLNVLVLFSFLLFSAIRRLRRLFFR